ncbi:MAG: phosphoribosyl-AMP cyclohydrolase [Pseudomonadota bacterium]
MNSVNTSQELSASLTWNADGLIPAIAQDHRTREVLMMAWMNAEALAETINTKQAVYYSRSRQKLWRKGEESGHTQTVHAVKLDCDGDVILLEVTQVGGTACHTGRCNCFYRTHENGAWKINAPVLIDPKVLYA